MNRWIFFQNSLGSKKNIVKHLFQRILKKVNWVPVKKNNSSCMQLFPDTSSCPLLAVLFLSVFSWQTCPCCPVLAVLSRQSYPGFPVLADLPGSPVLEVLFCQPRPFLAELSFPGSPVFPFQRSRPCRSGSARTFLLDILTPLKVFECTENLIKSKKKFPAIWRYLLDFFGMTSTDQKKFFWEQIYKISNFSQ